MASKCWKKPISFFGEDGQGDKYGDKTTMIWRKDRSFYINRYENIPTRGVHRVQIFRANPDKMDAPSHWNFAKGMGSKDLTSKNKATSYINKFIKKHDRC